MAALPVWFCSVDLPFFFLFGLDNWKKIAHTLSAWAVLLIVYHVHGLKHIL